MNPSVTNAWRLTVLWAGVPLVIGALNEYALSAALPSIRADLGITVGQAQWIFVAFLIADVAVLIAAGRYGDRVGVRKPFAIGLGVIAVGALASALAPGFEWLVLARVVEGVGAGFMFSGILAVVANAVPREHLGRAFGLWAMVGAFAVLLSPLVGGVLTEYASWRWILVISAAVSVLALATLRRFLPEAAPNPAPAPSMRAIVSRPNFAGATAVTSLVYLVSTLNLFCLPFYLYATSGLTPARLGLMYLAYGLWWLVLPPFTGRLSDRIGLRKPFLLGLALAAVGLLVLAVAAGTAGIPGIVIGLSLLGIGAAFVLPNSNAATMASVEPDHRATASGLNMTCRLVGSIVGVVIGASLLQAISGNSTPVLGAAGGIDTAAMWIWGIGAVAMIVAIVIVLTSIRERDSFSAS